MVRSPSEGDMGWLLTGVNLFAADRACLCLAQMEAVRKGLKTSQERLNHPKAFQTTHYLKLPL
jgi:hypothetical protein